MPLQAPVPPVPPPRTKVLTKPLRGGKTTYASVYGEREHSLSVAKNDDLFKAPKAALEGKLWQGKQSHMDQLPNLERSLSDQEMEVARATQWEMVPDEDHPRYGVPIDAGAGEYDDDYDDSFDEVPSFRVLDGEAGRGDTSSNAEEIRKNTVLETQSDRLENELSGGGGGRRRSLTPPKEEEEEGSDEESNGTKGKGKGRGKGERKVGSGDGRYGAGRGQGQANQRKDRNKAKVGNHNRKAASGRKAKAMV